jgi:hypothetical protein
MAKRQTRQPKKRKQRATIRRRPRTAARPNTREAFIKMPDKQRQDYTSAVNAVAKMRADGLSLPKAARAVGIDAKTVRRLAGPALRKDKRGRWTATKRDRLVRVLSVPGPRGSREIAVSDSRAAVHIARYFEAVRRYIHKDDASGLIEFRKLKLVDTKGKRITLVTSLRVLLQLGHAGVLSFESLYARTA